MTGVEARMHEFDQALAELPLERREQLVRLFALVLQQGRGAEESITPRMKEALSGLLGWAMRNVWRGMGGMGALLKDAFGSHAPTAVALLADIEARRG
jgi:hypothetical protein